MQIILREDVKHLGRVGEVVTVKGGFGRNYLIPRGLAVIATPRSVRRLDHEKRVIEQREQKLRRNGEVLKGQLEKLSLSISKQVGEEEKLFGSVTNREVAEVLKEKGFEIKRKAIRFDEPIKTLGVHQVKVRVARDLDVELKVWVVADE